MDLEPPGGLDQLQLTRDRHGAAPSLRGHLAGVLPVIHPADEQNPAVLGANVRPGGARIVISTVVEPKRRTEIRPFGRRRFQLPLQVGIETKQRAIKVTYEILSGGTAIWAAGVGTDQKNKLPGVFSIDLHFNKVGTFPDTTVSAPLTAEVALMRPGLQLLCRGKAHAFR